jgi:cobalt/nickel transport system permease protein
MIGTLFLRSFHRGERVYMAMLSRGYRGTMPETKARGLGLWDVLFLSLAPCLLFLRIYLG